jgi:hypothetical protein
MCVLRQNVPRVDKMPVQVNVKPIPKWKLGLGFSCGFEGLGPESGEIIRSRKTHTGSLLPNLH